MKFESKKDVVDFVHPMRHALSRYIVSCVSTCDSFHSLINVMCSGVGSKAIPITSFARSVG